MDDNREEVIDERVEVARERLATRLDTLERKVVNAVDDASAVVRDTAGTVQSTVTKAVDDVRQLSTTTADGAKQLFDVPQHVREYPWASLGLAALAGLITGLATRRTGATIDRDETGPQASVRRSALSDLFDVARREFTKLGEEAIVAGILALKQNLQNAAAEISTQRQHERNGVHDSR